MDSSKKEALEATIRSALPFELDDRRLTVVAILVAAAIGALSPIGVMYAQVLQIFNYVNNVADAHPLFYLNDWVSFYSSLIAYSIRDLPFVVQGSSYIAISIDVIVAL